MRRSPDADGAGGVPIRSRVVAVTADVLDPCDTEALGAITIEEEFDDRARSSILVAQRMHAGHEGRRSLS